MFDTRTPVEVFLSYAEADEPLCVELETHLALLKREGLITTWHKGLIGGGTDKNHEIDKHLSSASLILLMLSAHFVASDSCYGIEMQSAVERHKRGNAFVIPVLLRPMDSWHNTPFGKLQPLPTSGIPITTWSDPHAAFADVAQGIRAVLQDGKFPEAFTPSPHTCILFPRDPLFQSRPGEFEYLENLLFGPQMAHQPARVGLVGIIGMGGIGKTHLAVELAYRCQEQRRFPEGIFWMTAMGTDVFAWQRHFARLAVTADYLPSDDDAAHPENEARRARHLCRYLAEQADALLILDNVDAPDLVSRIFPLLIGREAQCTIIYTSRLTTVPETITRYTVDRLPEEVALRLLFKDTRPSLLRQIESGQEHDEIEFARGICQRADYLPLALVHLRGLLRRDRHVRLRHLYEAFTQQGIETLHDVLFKTFDLSWQQVQSEEGRRLFQLAALFPEATPCPLWLIGLAAGLDGSGEIIEPLGKALFHLQEVSLIEELSGNQVRLHPLVREFGQYLANENREQGRVLRREAAERLVATFTNIEPLEDFARKASYWDCLERVRQASEYLELVEQGYGKGELFLAQRLRLVHQWLDREAHLLGNEQWWPEKLPGFFCQQIFNQSVEDKASILAGTTGHSWIRQCESTGMTSPVLLKHFPISNFPKIAYSPDGNKLACVSWSKGVTTIYLWHADTGKLLFHESYESRLQLNLVLFSPDSQMFFIYNGGASLRAWDMVSFSCSQFILGSLQCTVEQLLELLSLAAIAISPDGKHVAITRDGTVLVAGLAEKEVLFALDAPKEKTSIKKIVFSPQGDKLGAISKGVSEYRGGSIYLWDIHTRKLIWTQRDMDAIDLAFSPENNLMLIGTAKKGIWRYDIHMGNISPICTLSATSYKCITFSYDMRKVAASVNSGLGKVELWDLQTKHCFRSVFHNDIVVDLVFSPDGKTLFTAGDDRSVRLWNIQEEAIQQKMREYWGRNIFCMGNISPTKIVFARENGTVELCDTQTGNQLLHLDNPEKEIDFIALSPDEKTIVTGSRDGVVYIWDTRTRNLLFSLPIIGLRVFQVATFASDSRHMLFTLHGGLLGLLDIKKKRSKILLKCKKDIDGILFSPDETHLFIFTSNSVQCYRVERLFWSFHLTLLWERSGWENVDGVREIILSPDSSRMLIIDRRTSLWDTFWGVPIKRDLYSGGCAAFSRDGGVLAVGHHNGIVNFWDARTGKFLSSLEDDDRRTHRSSVNAVSFSPDGSFFIVCDADGYILFWRIDDLRSQSAKLTGAYMMKEYPKKAVTSGKITIYWQSDTHLTIIDGDALSGSYARNHERT